MGGLGMRVRIVDDVAVSPNFSKEENSLTCFAPASWRLMNGDCIVVYRQGREKHSADGVFFAQRSIDGGKSWSDQITIFDRVKNAELESVHAGVVCQVSDGSVLAIFTTVEPSKEGLYVFSEEGKKQRHHFYISRSGDGGLTWSDPTEHFLQAAPRNTYIGSRPLVLQDGTLVLPVEGINEDGEQILLVALSKDGGRTLQPLITSVYDKRRKIGYGDTRLALLPDGKILMLLWTWLYETEQTQNEHRCLSTDGGVSWSEPESTNVRYQVMSPIFYKENTLITVANVRWPPAPGIHLLFSADSGLSWNGDSPVHMWDAVGESMSGTVVEIAKTGVDETEEKVWDALKGFTFGTPDLIQLEKDLFLMSYYATKDDVTHIRACRFEIEQERK
jgi:hypothetical protein